GRCLMGRIAVASAVSLTIAATLLSTAAADDDHYRDGIARWRKQREADLKSDDGWLTVCGLHWLHPGWTRVGSDPGNDLVLPERAPAWVGTFRLSDSKVSFRAAPGALVTRNGSPFEEGKLNSDADEHPDSLAAGGVKMLLLKRGQRYAIRLK